MNIQLWIASQKMVDYGITNLYETKSVADFG